MTSPLPFAGATGRAKRGKGPRTAAQRRLVRQQRNDARTAEPEPVPWRGKREPDART